MPGTQPKEPAKHPVNMAMETDPAFGARVADRVTGFMGSWRFVVIQTMIVIIWIVGNVVLLFHFDPFPFILLNLAFSTQAAYAAPLILLAGNRASQRDRMTLEHTATETDIEEQQNERLLRGNTEILQRVVRLEETILSLEGQIKTAIERLGPNG